MPPANDDFANAQALVGDSGSFDGDNTDATAQTPEPIVDDHGHGVETVWFTFTPAENGSFDLWTEEAPGGPGLTDTSLAIYSGAALGALTELAYNDDTAESIHTADTYSEVTGLWLTGGVTYRIVVTGFGDGQVGTFRLSWEFTPLPNPARDCGLVMRADATAAEAYALADLGASVNETWTEFWVAFSPETLAAGNAGAFFALLWPDIPDGITLLDLSGGSWDSDSATFAPPDPVAEQWQFIEVRWFQDPDGAGAIGGLGDAEYDIYIDGQFVYTSGRVEGGEDLGLRRALFGQAGGSGADWVAFIDDVTIRTARRGGTVLFADGFEDGTFDAWASTSGDVSIVDDPYPDCPVPVVPATTRAAGSPPWRFFITDRNSVTVSLLEQRSTDKTVVVTLNRPAVHQGKVASDDPEINLPYPDFDDDPNLHPNIRLCYGLRREGPTPENWLLSDGAEGAAYVEAGGFGAQPEVWLTMRARVADDGVEWWGDGNVSASMFARLLNGGSSTIRSVGLSTDGGPPAFWVADGEDPPDTERPITRGEHIVELGHVNGGTCRLYVDGHLLSTFTDGSGDDVEGFQVGLDGTVFGDSANKVYIDNVSVGTTRGAHDLFRSGFDDVDLGEWGTTGAASVVALDGPPWICRFGGLVMQVEDGGADAPTTTYTAYDPWQYWYNRPVRDDAGQLVGDDGLDFVNDASGTIVTLLANSILFDGTLYLDIASGTIDSVSGPSSFHVDKGMSLGEAIDSLVATGTVDVVLEPVYDPVARPGIVAVLNIHERAGRRADEAVFAWDKPGRNVNEVSRLIDGTRLVNRAYFYIGQGGPAVNVQQDLASVAKYGLYLAQQFIVTEDANFDLVDALALAQVLIRRDGGRSVTFDPAPERSLLPLRDYKLGDYLPVWASRNMRAPIAPDYDNAENPGAAGYLRVYAIPIEIDDAGVEHVRAIVTSQDSGLE